MIRSATKYDRLHAVDPELLIQFLDDTQPDEMAKLRKIYKADAEETIIAAINTAVTQRNGSLINCLKHGIDISGTKLTLMFTKPATTFNKKLNENYARNIFCQNFYRFSFN